MVNNMHSLLQIILPEVEIFNTEGRIVRDIQESNNRFIITLKLEVTKSPVG